VLTLILVSSARPVNGAWAGIVIFVLMRFLWRSRMAPAMINGSTASKKIMPRTIQAVDWTLAQIELCSGSHSSLHCRPAALRHHLVLNSTFQAHLGKAPTGSSTDRIAEVLSRLSRARRIIAWNLLVINDLKETRSRKLRNAGRSFSTIAGNKFANSGGNVIRASGRSSRLTPAKLLACDHISSNGVLSELAISNWQMVSPASPAQPKLL